MIANAVCHRSYLAPEKIQVALYDDRLEGIISDKKFKELAVKCDYNNLKASIALKFAGLDYKDWETYEPSSSERMIFKKCKAVADAFDEAVLMQEE